MKRGGPLQRRSALARRARLKPMSDKRRAVSVARRAFVSRVLAARPMCEAAKRIASVDDEHACGRDSVDVHEVKTRGRGGDILDEANVLALCRACHDWIHAHPATSLRVGLLASSWSADE